MVGSRRLGEISSSPHLEEGIRALTALKDSPPLKNIIEALNPGSDLHIVGGTVRDILLGQTGVDIDLATKLTPDEVTKRLEKSKIRVVPTGLRHGTVSAIIENSRIEITTFRTAVGGFSSSIEEDLLSRDFTINAVAFSLESLKVIDPSGGIDDLSSNEIRAVKDPVARFREDPLRVIRMIRFGPAEGRRVAESTKGAAKQSASLLSSVSVERIRSELDKILLSDKPGDAFREMADLGILTHLLPEILPTIGLEQNEFHIHDVFEHTLWVIENCPKDRILRLAALFHDIGKVQTVTVGDDGRRHFYNHEKISTEICRSVMERLKYSHDDVQSVSVLVALHMRPLDCGAPGVRRLIRELGNEFDRWRIFKKADRPPIFEENIVDSALERFDSLVQTEQARQKGSVFGRLALNGDDLKAIGVLPGPGMGKILKELETAVIENPDLNDKDSLLALAKKAMHHN